MNYDAYNNRNMELLQKDATVYGISFFGDGATIKKTPFLNILSSGVYLPSACLEIIDCSNHMSKGGKKDSRYIYDLFLPFIQKFENDQAHTVDLVLFDGASNVQKAGWLLAAKFPCISVVHGAEHVMSLLFNDLFKKEELQSFIKISQIVYKVFGSGSMHGPYATFQKYSKTHNKGHKIGLICAADTQMAGHIISLMRMLRLKDALKNTMVSVEIKEYKVIFFDFLHAISFVH